MGRRRHWLIQRYVLQEFLLAFVVAFLFFFVIFIINQMLLLAEDVLSKNVGVSEVLRLILYSIPLVAAISFPFGALVGSLMAMGRLSSDREVIAMRALGVPLRRVFLPFLLAGAVFSGVSFVTNDYFLPLGNINLSRLYRELITSNPELELEPYSIKRYQDNTIITGPAQDGRIEDLVIIEDGENGGSPRVISSDAAEVDNEPDSGVISLRLDSVFSHTPGGTGQESADRTEQEYFSAEGMIYNILLRDITISIQSPGPAEMSSKDVLSDIRAKEEDLEVRRRTQARETAVAAYELLQRYNRLVRTPGSLGAADVDERLRQSLEVLQELRNEEIRDRSLQRYRLEFHKKFAIPAACLAFVLFAFPVGLMPRRSGRTVGFGLGLLVAVVYWSLLVAGDTLGTRDLDLSPVLAMWAPNALVVLAGLMVLLVRKLR
jgi:lipopolysaccharide export system permease protein